MGTGPRGNTATSLERLEAKTHRNRQATWLMLRLSPGVKTIGDLRRDNGDGFRADFGRVTPRHP